MINETTEEFIIYVTQQRKANKNKWVFAERLVNGQHVMVKFYNTYLQRYEVDNHRKESGTMEMSVKAFNCELLEGLENNNAY